MDDPTSFLALRQACHDARSHKHELLATLRKAPIDQDIIDRLDRRALHLGIAGDWFAALSQQEKTVREMVRVGALVDFPEWTPNLARLDVGDEVLARGRLLDLDHRECQVHFTATRSATMVWVVRENVIGVRKRIAV
jgi:hypothetical protein